MYMAHHMKGVKYIRIIYNAIHLPMIALLVKTDAIMGIQEHCKCLRGYKDINKSYGYIGETGDYRLFSRAGSSASEAHTGMIKG